LQESIWINYIIKFILQSKTEYYRCQILLNYWQYHSIVSIFIKKYIQNSITAYTKPSNLYINWAAALQIQFHISKVDQNFASKKKDWAKEYLKNFVDSAKRRIIKQKKDYVDVFLPFI
jgi:hypothetical protein